MVSNVFHPYLWHPYNWLICHYYKVSVQQYLLIIIKDFLLNYINPEKKAVRKTHSLSNHFKKRPSQSKVWKSYYFPEFNAWVAQVLWSYAVYTPHKQATNQPPIHCNPSFQGFPCLMYLCPIPEVLYSMKHI